MGHLSHIGPRSEPQPPAIRYTQAGCADSAHMRAWLTERGVVEGRQASSIPGRTRSTEEGGRSAWG